MKFPIQTRIFSMIDIVNFIVIVSLFVVVKIVLKCLIFVTIMCKGNNDMKLKKTLVTVFLARLILNLFHSISLKVESHNQ